MKALFTGVVGTPESPGTGFTLTPEGAASLEAARTRPLQIQAGLRSLLGLSAEQQVDYRALTRIGTREGRVVPEAGALVIDAMWGDGKNRSRIWVDDGSRIDEYLAAEFGWEADFKKARGIALDEEINDITGQARSTAIAETQRLREAELVRLSTEAA